MENLHKVADELKAAHAEGKNAVELALLSREKLGAKFGVISFIASFRLAFNIPLPALQRAQAWQGFHWGDRSISDDEFSTILSPWLAKPEENSYIHPQTRANAKEHGISHASEEVIAEWHALAESVCRELQHAGLPAYVQHPSARPDRQTGACVYVDTIEGPAGGVHVSWNAGESLTEAVFGFIQPDRLDLLEPVIAHGTRIVSLMDEAIKSVLVLAGFRTRDAVELNDMTSGTHVAGRRPRQWYVEHILAEGVLGLVASIRSCDPSGDDPAERGGISADGKARLTGRGIRAVQNGLHRLADDDRQALTRAFRTVAGAMHSQDMAHRGFWKADRSLLELPDELCLPAQEPPATAGTSVTPALVLAAAYIALLGSIELADEDTVDDDDAVKITEAWTGTLLRRLDQAPEEDRQELIRLFREAAREETDPAHQAFASGFPEAIGLVETGN